MARSFRPRMESLESRTTPARVVPGPEKLAGDFNAPHTTTEIMAFVRSENAVGLLSEFAAHNRRTAALIDPLTSRSLFNDNGVSLVQVGLVAGADPASTANWLATYSDVVWTAPNAIFQGDATELTPNDPQFGSQYHLSKMQLPTAWNTTTGSSSIVLAIADLGTAYNHPDLAANIWSNADEIAGNGIDDDANGFIDDIRGWDFTAAGLGDNDPNPSGSGNHGTHTAGIAAARTNNGVGVAGVAGGDGTAGSGIRIMPLRWDGSGSWTAARVANTFTYAADNGAKIVSASYNFDGWASNSVVIAAFNYSYGQGVLHFNSAGNGNQLNPARQVFEQCLFVSSTDSNDVKSSFSNYGVFADIAAPGSNVLATTCSSSGTVFTYGSLSGTSMSTPNAAGVAALIWSAHPTWTREQVVAQLLGTADNIDSINPSFAGLLGTGRANAARSVTETLPAPRIGTLTGLPVNGGTTLTAPTSVSIVQPMRLDPATVLASSFEMRGDGPDGAFNTADDVLVPLTLTAGATYRVGTNTLAMTIGSMPQDRYRFVAKSSALSNPFGTALDGDANGTPGGDFIREFTFGQPIQVSGVAFEDWDADGVRGPADPPLAGVTVYRDTNNSGGFDAGEQTAVSSAAGTFSFSGVPTGNHVFRRFGPAGTTPTGAASFAVSLPTGTSTANFDVGQIRSDPAVYGRVFNDTNGNGAPDAGETGQAGRVVYDDFSGDGILNGGEASTTTDALGNYRLPVGTGFHAIRLDYLAGQGATLPADNFYGVPVGTGPATGFNFGQRADSVAPTATLVAPASASRVTQLTVTFDETVTFDNNDVPGAFTLTKVGGGTVALNATSALVGGHTEVTITFADTTEFGSLTDGRYALTVDSSRVLDIARNQLQSVAPLVFHRLFGDSDGNATVNAFDYSAFRDAFGTSTGNPAYVEALDFDLSGAINAFDFGAFRDRFGVTIP